MSTLLVALGALGLVAAAVSLLLGAILLADGSWLERLAPPAQSRIVLAAVLAPMLIAVAFAGAVIVDLGVLGCTAHHCAHHAAGAPLALQAVGALLLIRFVTGSANALRALRRSRSARRALESVSTQAGAGFCVLPFAEPQAFVLGGWRPRVFVSRGLLDAASSEEIDPVLAHERAHALRRDPLCRMIATLALAFHLPALAPALRRRLIRSQEIAADAEAARTIGDGPRMAGALLRFARLRLAGPMASMAPSFAGDLEARVKELLLPGARPDQPRALVLGGLAVATLVGALALADSVHHGLETALAVLGG